MVYSRLFSQMGPDGETHFQLKTQKYILDIQLYFRSCIFLIVAIAGYAVTGQDLSTPNMVTIDNEGRVSITFSPQNHDLLGLFYYRDQRILGIEVSADNNFSIWKNGILLTPETKSRKFTTDQLLSGEEDTVFLAFHARSNFENFKSRFITEAEIRQEEKNPIFVRSTIFSKNAFVLFTLAFILLIGSYKYLSSVSLLEYFRKIFFKRMRIYSGFEEARLRIHELIIISLSVGISMWQIKGNHDQVIGYELSTQIYDVLLYSGYTLLFLAGKFVLLRSIARLNGLEKFETVQFIDFTKFYLILSLILNAILFFLYWMGDVGEYSISANWEYFYPITYLIFIVFYFFKLSNVLPRKKLLLISYLCTTEILGAFIVSIVLIS